MLYVVYKPNGVKLLQAAYTDSNWLMLLWSLLRKVMDLHHLLSQSV